MPLHDNKISRQEEKDLQVARNKQSGLSDEIEVCHGCMKISIHNNDMIL